MEISSTIHTPACPNCEEKHTFQRHALSKLYTCPDCGMIFEWDKETKEKEMIKFDIVYDQKKHVELIKEEIRKQEKENNKP